VSSPTRPSRLLLARPRVYCAGVERAVEAVEQMLVLHGPPIYVRKQIVHNIHVVRDLEARGAIFVESGPADDPHIRLRFRPLPHENWHVDVRTSSKRWEPIPFVGPRGNMVAWLHQDFPWLLAPDP